MKIKAFPLAAAVLALAAAAQAQLLNPAPPAGNFGSAPGGIFSTTGSGGADLNSDMTYKCGSVPWRPCTSAENDFRKKILRGLPPVCPEPQLESCHGFLVREGPQDPSATVAFGPKDFYQKCGTVPYRLCTAAEQRQQDAWKAGQKTPPAAGAAEVEMEEIVVTGRRYDQQPGFIGPPAPPNPANFEDIAKSYPDAINLGGGDYAIPDENDPNQLTVCTAGSCDRKSRSEMQARIDANAADSAMFTGSSAGGQTNAGRQVPVPTVPVIPDTGDSRSVAPMSGGGAVQDAADVAAAQGQIGRSVAGSGAGPGWTGSGTASAGASGTTSEVVKVDGSTIKVDDIEVTFEGNQRMMRRLDQAAQEMTTGQVEDLITTDGQTSAAKRGRIVEPPVDAAVLGKQQFNANGTQPK